MSTPARSGWWRNATGQRTFSMLYLALGVVWIVDAATGHHRPGWVLGAAFLLVAALGLGRRRSSLRGDTIVVQRRVFLVRRIAVPDIAEFAVPHRFAVTTRPHVVLRNGERVLLPDVDEQTLRAWSAATSVPVTQDSSPH